MNWVLEHLQLLIGAAAAIAYYLNRRRQTVDGDDVVPKPKSREAEEQAERTRRVQEEIRRKIAERRGGQSPAEPPVRRSVPPLVRAERVPPLDPFGGPMRRVLKKLEPTASKTEPQADARTGGSDSAEMARQARLAEQLRELEAVRAAHERRAAELRASKQRSREQRNTTAVFVNGRESLRDALRNPAEVRRAVVLREILSAPVGLRKERG